MGLIYHYRIKNSLQAVYAITTLTERDPIIIDKFYKEFNLQKIERIMIEMDNREVNKTAEINKYFSYTNKLVQFEEKIEICVKDHI